MEKDCILSIDRGQSQIKAALCGQDAHILCVRSCQCEPIQTPRKGWAQQDMRLMWEQTAALVRRLFRESGIEPGRILAVSFSGQGGGNFLVDTDGKPAYPGVLSLDNRHREIAEASQGADVPRTVAFMRWLKEKEPGVFDRTRWILGSKDWLRYCLTGEAYADMSDTPVPADAAKRTYDLECLRRAGVPECERMLPPLVYASELCGRVTHKAAELTGIPEGTPVAAGAHDMIACSVGAGGDHEGHLTIILGTLGINIAVIKDSVGDALPGELFTFGGAAPGLGTATTSIGSACSTMDRVIKTLYREETDRLREAGEDFFPYIEEKLKGRKPVDMIFQPYLMGTFYNSAAKAGLIGATAETTREDIVQAAYQGICISMCAEIEKLESRAGTMTDIWLTGGGSNSRIWRQMFADVLGRPVHVGQCSELGCRGAALCAGMALGCYSIDDLPVMEPAQTCCPRGETAGFYSRQRELYKYAYDMSARLWNGQ